VQSQGKQRLHQIWMAPDKATAKEASDYFLDAYGAKYPKAVDCLAKDREALLTFCDFRIIRKTPHTWKATNITRLQHDRQP
jgi:transposase-like protein